MVELMLWLHAHKKLIQKCYRFSFYEEYWKNFFRSLRAIYLIHTTFFLNHFCLKTISPLKRMVDENQDKIFIPVLCPFPLEKDSLII